MNKKKHVIIAAIVGTVVATGLAVKKFGAKAVTKTKTLFSKKSENSDVVETEEVKTEE